MLFLILGVTAISAFPPNLWAEDCSEITKYSIFDVRKSSTAETITMDVIHWLSTSEFLTETGATNAAAKVGFQLPQVKIPINADGSYGESHSKTWSKAAAEYLRQETRSRKTFADEFRTANPNIIAAWQACVTQAKGLICWAKQTDNPNEIQLFLELRYLTTDHPSKIFVPSDGIEYSKNLSPYAKSFDKELGAGSPTNYLFTRNQGAAYDLASNFNVTTDATDYRCSAAAPKLPTPTKVGDTVQTGDYQLDNDQCRDLDNKGNHQCRWTPTTLRPAEPKSRFEVSVALDIDTAIDPDNKYPDTAFSNGCNRSLANNKLPGGYIKLECGSATSLRQNTIDPGVTDSQRFKVTKSCESEGSPVEVTVIALPVGCGWMTLKKSLVTWKEIKE